MTGKRNAVVDPGAIVAAVEAFWRDHDELATTVREIQEATGISTPSLVRFHVQRLAQAGRIRWEPGIARSIRPARRDAA